MYCISPIAVRNDLFPCGQCRTCRINRRRDWQARLLLEAATSSQSAFVTLTLRDPPVGPFFPSLRPSHLTDFWKRWRYHYGFLRYVAVGEYGDRTSRPHYHALMFTEIPVDKLSLEAVWGLGSVDVGDVEPASIDYVMAYVLKSAFQRKETVDGIYPEFARHSLGIGKFSLSEFRRLARPNDDGELVLPSELRIGGRIFPFPKYLRRRLKEEGFAFETKTPSPRELFQAQVHSLYEGSSPITEGSSYEEKKSAFQRAYLSSLRNRAASAHQRVLNRTITGVNRNETF